MKMKNLRFKALMMANLMLLTLFLISSCSKDTTDDTGGSVTPGETYPAISFSVSDSIAENGKIIQFFDESEALPLSWKWSFGDQSNSFEQNPLKKYYETGEFTVKLIVEYADRIDSLEKTHYIKVIDQPEAAFIADKRLVENGTEIQFTDLSVNGVTTWEWDFGDGTTSTEQNPVKTYIADGEYSVSLKVQNEYGWENTMLKEEYISVGAMEFVDPRDGQVYGMVNIGDQIWMTRNLNYQSNYAVYYDYNEDYADDFGALYPGYHSSNNNPVPNGWHIPSIEEWEELFDFVGGESVAGGKLKENNSNYWHSPNSGATNDYGFSARGGGYSEFNEFQDIKECGVYHTSSGYWDEYSEVYVSIGVMFRNDATDILSYYYLSDYYESELSIRLIKD